MPFPIEDIIESAPSSERILYRGRCSRGVVYLKEIDSYHSQVKISESKPERFEFSDKILIRTMKKIENGISDIERTICTIPWLFGLDVTIPADTYIDSVIWLVDAFVKIRELWEDVPSNEEKRICENFCYPADSPSIRVEFEWDNRGIPHKIIIADSLYSAIAYRLCEMIGLGEKVKGNSKKCRCKYCGSEFIWPRVKTVCTFCSSPGMRTSRSKKGNSQRTYNKRKD